MIFENIRIAVVGTSRTRVHHHHTINLFCCLIRALKKNMKESLTLAMVVPNSVAVAFCNLSS
jgi:hypothetical protein